MRYFQHVLNPGRIESVRHLSDAADIARSHATLPVVATGEVSR